jgi:murein L,D-transpeptidase YcbB/YkuD
MKTQPTTGKLNPVSTNPNLKPATHFAVLFSYKPIILITVFLSVLILSTSFQSGRNEMVRIESEYLVPDLINGLKTSLSETAGQSPTGKNNEGIVLYNEVRRFYALHAYRPAWTSFNHVNRNGESLISLIENAREYGLEPVHYHINKLREIQLQIKDDGNRSQHGQNRMELEMLLTDAALKLMVNLHGGYMAFDSTLLSSGWISTLPAILMEGVKQGKPVEQILSVQPRFIEYSQLQAATVNFVRNTSLSDDSLFIAEADKDSVEFYNQVKNALVRLGYAKRNSRKEEIVAGLKEFQQHHGLENDGKPGMNTLEALRMTTLYHYRMLALNLNRLRKQENSEMHLLYVNIPAYQLKVFRQNKLLDTYRVIVGTPKTPTPQLVSKVERVIANPVWDVPTSIAQNELLPKIKADSGYLRRNNFRLVDRHNKTVNSQDIDIDRISNAEYFIRQDASSDNALGKVKFIFSNPYAVYLHDTPGKTLFAKDTRDMSHGCVRLQNPEKLAEYLVNVVQSDSTDISGLITRGIRREFNLAIAVPIHISYITCDADDKGNLYFYRDIYGIDEKELAELQPFMGI